MFKYLKFSFLFLGLILIFIPSIVSAQYRTPEAVNIYFFYGDGCPHCADEEDFFDKKLTKDFSNIKIYRFETFKNKNNNELLQLIIEMSKLQVTGVPVTFIGNRVINGYYNDNTTGAEIISAVEYFQATGDPDLVGKIINQEEVVSPPSKNKTIYDEGVTDKKPEFINLPILGQVDVKNFSLPILTVLIGFLDGFNPCAMWVLLFLISMLLGMQNRKRMWAIGMTFIIASGVVYFMFMAAWLNVFLFVGFISWIRLLIGLVAIGSGWYHLREFAQNKDGTCKVTTENKRTKIINKIKNIIQEKSFTLALIGIIGLAVAVNMVELVCSAGLPAIYTSILSATNLASWQYYVYLLLYILIFIIDDLVIFVIAMVSLHVTGITKKYVRMANLIGGIVMLIIGVLLIFKPEWLLFG